MKLGRLIARHSVLIIVIAAALMVPAAIGFIATRVNYDILSYLPQDLESMKGEAVLDRDFHDAYLSILIVRTMEAKDVIALEERIRGVEGVLTVMGAGDVLSPSVPPEILPDGVRRQLYAGDSTLVLIKYKESGVSPLTQKAIGEVRALAGSQCLLSGVSPILKDTKDLVDRETPLYVLLAVVFSVVVLILTMESPLIPAVFLAEIGVAILYNFGTNIFLGQISYITKALAAVLQLGVTMDFSIFLLNRYEEERARLPDDHREAMARAIHKTFLTISAGGLTEMAGFLSLCVMTLTLGVDIGLVMAKGVVMGLLCTMTLLPSMILVLDGPLHRIRHRPLLPTFTRATGWITRHPRAVSVVFILLFIPALYGNFHVKQYYNLTESLPADMPSMVATNKLKADYHMTTSHFILVHDTVPAYRIRALVTDIKALPGITNALASESLMGPLIPSQIIPEQVRSIFSQNGWELVMVNSEYHAATADENRQVDAITALVKEVDPGAYITGEGVLTKDLIKVAALDFKRVDWVSIVAIFVIILAIFGSVSVPVLMVSGIELSIFLNMAFSWLIGETIPFIATIVIGCIQLGVTIDYAILLVTRFREELRLGRGSAEAMRTAAEASSRSIVTSALTLFAATFGVGLVSKVAILNSLCMMIARGALISMTVILFIMPATFIVSEKVVAATSLNWRAPARRRAAKE
jgi:uncharacterized protein